MRTLLRAPIPVVLLIAALAAAGCGKKAPEETTQAPAEVTPAVQAPSAGQESGHGDHGAPVPPVTPAATADAAWDQIAAGQKKLEAAIQNGQLADVHHLAFSIRDLVEALAAKTTGLSAADVAALKQAVAAVRTSAGKLDQFGDSGNLGGTEKEYAQMVTLLGQVKAIASKGRMSSATTGPRSQPVQLAGEIIDPQCYFTHDGRGLAHAACAELCARGGQGLSFLEDHSGRVLPLIAKAHGASQNEGLYPHLGKPVTIKGVVFSRGENSVLLIQSVAPGTPIKS